MLISKDANNNNNNTAEDNNNSNNNDTTTTTRDNVYSRARGVDTEVTEAEVSPRKQRQSKTSRRSKHKYRHKLNDGSELKLKYGIETFKSKYEPLDVMQSLALLNTMRGQQQQQQQQQQQRQQSLTGNSTNNGNSSNNNTNNNNTVTAATLSESDFLTIDSEGNTVIDFKKAGECIGGLRKAEGNKESHNHLEVINSLALLEKVWRASQEGLELDDFIDFLSNVLTLPRAHLRSLFQKMDCDADGSLTWDEFLSYLLREVRHKWHLRSARGTCHVAETDIPAIPLPPAPDKLSLKNKTCGSSSVKQILVIPSTDSTNNSRGTNGRYVLACEDNTIAVWNSDTMTFHSYLPQAPGFMTYDHNGNNHHNRTRRFVCLRWFAAGRLQCCGSTPRWYSNRRP
jgi:hypothetical protein